MKKLVIFCSFVISCADGDIQEEEYYFPVENFWTQRTYNFINESNVTEMSQWKMRTFIMYGDTLMETIIVDGQGRTTDVITERIANGMSILKDYILYDYDSLGQQQISNSTVLDSIVFSEKQKSGEQIQWKIEFVDARTGDTCELTKVRTQFDWAHNLKIFRDTMTFERINKAQGYQYYMEATYQKNIGLIHYKLTFPDGTIKNFKLEQ